MFATINYKGLWLEIIAMLMMVLASEFLVALSWLHCKKRALLSDNLVLKYLLPYLILLPVIFVFDVLSKIFGYHYLWTSSFGLASVIGFFIKYLLQAHSWLYFYQTYKIIEELTEQEKAMVQNIMNRFDYNNNDDNDGDFDHNNSTLVPQTDSSKKINESHQKEAYQTIYKNNLPQNPSVSSIRKSINSGQKVKFDLQQNSQKILSSDRTNTNSNQSSKNSSIIQVQMAEKTMIDAIDLSSNTNRSNGSRKSTPEKQLLETLVEKDDFQQQIPNSQNIIKNGSKTESNSSPGYRYDVVHDGNVNDQRIIVDKNSSNGSKQSEYNNIGWVFG